MKAADVLGRSNARSISHPAARTEPGRKKPAAIWRSYCSKFHRLPRPAEESPK